MRLLKIVGVIFLIYFIRRFFQMYKAMKIIQDEQLRDTMKKNAKTTPENSAIDADYRVID